MFKFVSISQRALESSPLESLYCLCLLSGQIAIVVLALIAVATAKPAPQYLASYTAPGAYAPYATAVASREYYGASPYYGAAYTTAPYVAAVPAAYSAYSAYPYYY